jgi:hypothetical protein
LEGVVLAFFFAAVREEERRRKHCKYGMRFESY